MKLKHNMPRIGFYTAANDKEIIKLQINNNPLLQNALKLLLAYKNGISYHRYAKELGVSISDVGTITKPFEEMELAIKAGKDNGYIKPTELASEIARETFLI